MYSPGHRAFVYPRSSCHTQACVRSVFAGAETASLRENRPSRDPRAFHRKAISPRLTPLEGRAPHAREGRRHASHNVAPLLATGSSSTHRLQMECLGIRGASQRGRTECVPPRKPPARYPRVSPLGHLTLDSPSPRRGGLRTPAMTALASRRPLSFGNRPFDHPFVARKPLATRTAWTSFCGNPTTN